MSDLNERAQLIAIWERAVQTQMHFNEMQAKSRQLGLTFVAAALGLGIVLASRNNDYSFSIPIGGQALQLHVSVLLTLAAVLALQAVRQLDLNVYHRMLRGAVTFGEDFERNCLGKIFELEKGMTEAISHFSRHDDAHVTQKEGRNVYCGSSSVSAENKIRSFYRRTSWFLAFASVLLFFATNSDLVSRFIGDGSSEPRSETSGDQVSGETSQPAETPVDEQ